jgi:hypothetical protein
LDAQAFGSLLHEILEKAVVLLESTVGGLAGSDPAAVRRAVAGAADLALASWPKDRPVPPPVVWRRKVEDARHLAVVALSQDGEPLPGQRSWAEIPFGGQMRSEAMDEDSRSALPWDPRTPVLLSSAGIAVEGSIDRLDVSGDGTSARVRDYKSGRPPSRRTPVVLRGGRELQRCLYAHAVRTLLPVAEVRASLVHPRARDGGVFELEDATATLDVLAGFVDVAVRLFVQGLCLPGEGAEDAWNEMAFALPGGAKEVYFDLKRAAVAKHLEDLPSLWEMN